MGTLAGARGLLVAAALTLFIVSAGMALLLGTTLAPPERTMGGSFGVRERADYQTELGRRVAPVRPPA